MLRDRDTDGNGSLDERLYAMQDANWNVTGIANDGASVGERYLYAPYGNVTIYDATWSTKHTVSVYSNTVLYAGREVDLETRFYDYRVRYYYTELGRFAARDPIVYGARAPNLYEYVSSQPHNAVDPGGLLPTTPNYHHWFERDCHPAVRRRCGRGSSVLVGCGIR